MIYEPDGIEFYKVIDKDDITYLFYKMKGEETSRFFIVNKAFLNGINIEAYIMDKTKALNTLEEKYYKSIKKR